MTGNLTIMNQTQGVVEYLESPGAYSGLPIPRPPLGAFWILSATSLSPVLLLMQVSRSFPFKTGRRDSWMEI